MKNSGTFIRSLIPADANNIVTLIDFNQVLAPYQEFTIDNIVEHSIILEDLQCKVGLFALLECDWPNTNALASESAMEAERARIIKEGQKIYLGIYHAYGNGPWIKKGEEILQNKNNLEQPWALMAPLFSTNETALLDEDLKIGVRVEAKAQGSGGLKGSDYLHIFGSWRKVTNIRKKKDNGVEALNDRISALETLLSVYGAPSATLPGSNGLVPAPPAGSEEFLLRGDREWQNPTKFVTPAQVPEIINNFSRFRAAASTPQSIPALTFTKIIFDSEITDTHNQYSESTLTATSNEVWQITVSIAFYCSVNTRIIIYVYKNNALAATSQLCDMVANAGVFAVNLSILEFVLEADDYLEVVVYASNPVYTMGDASLSSVVWGGKRIA